MTETLRLSFVIRALLVLLGAALIARMGGFVVSDLFARQSPQVALAVEPAHAAALFAKSRQPSEDRDAVREAAQRALARDPLTPGARRMLAELARDHADVDRAVQSTQLAARADPRDLSLQSWLFDQELRRGSYGDAMARFDLIMRGQSRDVWPGLAVAIMPLLKEPGVRAAFMSLVATDPPWRADVLRQVAQRGADLRVVVELFGALSQAGAPLREAELRPYLERLLSEGQGEHAYLAWLASLPPDRLRDAGFLYNAAFQHPVTHLPFDWQIEQARGALVNIRSEGDVRWLAVDFFGGRVPFRHVTHLMALPPGSYAFSGEERARSLRNDRGLRWVIACLGEVGEPLGASRLLSGEAAWRRFVVAFDVPEGCPVQQLRLELPARSVLEQEASGGVAYRHLTVERR